MPSLLLALRADDRLPVEEADALLRDEERPEPRDDARAETLLVGASTIDTVTRPSA